MCIFLGNQNRWQCRNKHSKRQFSLKTGTIYEESPLGLDKWLARDVAGFELQKRREQLRGRPRT